MIFTGTGCLLRFSVILTFVVCDINKGLRYKVVFILFFVLFAPTYHFVPLVYTFVPLFNTFAPLVYIFAPLVYILAPLVYIFAPLV